MVIGITRFKSSVVSCFKVFFVIYGKLIGL